MTTLTSTDNLFTEAIERLFASAFSPATLHDATQQGAGGAHWAQLEESGFLDVLLPESAGGAGLALAQAFPLFLSAGYHAVPLPYVQTALARAWLHAVGITAPKGAITIAGLGACQDEHGVHAYAVPFGRVADWLLYAAGNRALLLPIAAARKDSDLGHGSLLADLHWGTAPTEALAAHTDATLNIEPAVLCAASLAPLMAGAAARVLALTLDYANQRTQFGKSIGRFQAIQNQISVLAERTWASRMAAQIACQDEGWMPRPLMAAIGKTRCSEAAVLIADIAHAVHGAIGITEEYDLQLYTRCLREWRNAGGTEAWWAARIGGQLLHTDAESAIDFIQTSLAAMPAFTNLGGSQCRA
ncbi:acyl-CoA dehydrogenase family protein [Paracandidimonas lactea]|uniref:acyl-CoA dehydrogenase family protein n=1 Tax=Paracandidimonas lactea TaxID=2895524 RepID=UPI001F3A4C69|nr:acyl-CoA dehydrogenase [Paracandidimonas lactea]